MLKTERKKERQGKVSAGKTSREVLVFFVLSTRTIVFDLPAALVSAEYHAMILPHILV